LQFVLESHPTFLVDGMLGSTARKLRILGFDTAYDVKSSDQVLVQEALSSGRTLLTGDVELFFRAKSARAKTILVKGRREEDRLYEILSKSGITEIRIFEMASRCSVCNGELKDTNSKNSNSVEIYFCSSCGKKYWQGSHWKKMTALFGSVNSRLSRSREMN
jgi:uncharacterized protein